MLAVGRIAYEKIRNSELYEFRRCTHAHFVSERLRQPTIVRVSETAFEHKRKNLERFKFETKKHRDECKAVPVVD